MTNVSVNIKPLDFITKTDGSYEADAGVFGIYKVSYYEAIGVWCRRRYGPASMVETICSGLGYGDAMCAADRHYEALVKEYLIV